MNPLDRLPSADLAPGRRPARSQIQFSPYRVFSREEWAKLRADTPMTLVPRDLEQLSGLIEELSMAEVEQIYLPMSRLLNLHVAGAQELHTRHEPLPRPQGRSRPLCPRHRRIGGRRQEHDRTRAEGPAGALAGPSARGPHHDRRLPLPQRRVGAARAHGPQGLSRKLRHGAPAQLPARREIRDGQRRRLRSTRTSTTTSSRARRRSSIAPTC